VKAELCRQALEKVGNPNILINLISRRVRQLTGASGSNTRPLITETAGLGAADIALVELVDAKMSWEAIVEPEGKETPAKRRRRS